jgi:hypothetical protein
MSGGYSIVLLRVDVGYTSLCNVIRRKLLVPKSGMMLRPVDHFFTADDVREYDTIVEVPAINTTTGLPGTSSIASHTRSRTCH